MDDQVEFFSWYPKFKKAKFCSKKKLSKNVNSPPKHKINFFKLIQIITVVGLKPLPKSQTLLAPMVIGYACHNIQLQIINVYYLHTYHIIRIMDFVSSHYYY